MSVLFARWKRAKITTEHVMHVLRAYRVSLTSLRPNQGKQHKNWAEEHAPHIAKWAAHTTIADAPPFHGEMSYNDKYMVWFRPHTVRHITKETSYWDTLVESPLRIMAKCEPWSEIYTDCINALQSVEEIDQLTLDDARDVGNTSETVVGRGQQAGGRQGHGGRQSSLLTVTLAWLIAPRVGKLDHFSCFLLASSMHSSPSTPASLQMKPL
uniref:Uncharacterized protein n=1 Tax=Quercus lobata TaxID=97700 RepID=A0A7N2KPT4_QUELO